MTQAREYELDHAQFQRAISLLEKERQSIALSRAQRVSYRIFTIFLTLFFISLPASIICMALSEPSAKEPGIIRGIFLFLLGLSLIGAFLCVPLNLSLMLKIYRQKRNLRRLGFSHASEILWKEQSRRRRWVRLAGRVAFILGLLLFVADVAMWIAIRKVLPFYSFVGLSLVMFPFLQEGKAWLDMVGSRLTEITQLEASLLGLQQGAQASKAQRILVPRETIEKLAEIDTERIVRGRANAIAEAAQTKWMDFSVLTSREVLAAKTELDADSRIKVEEAIEKLMQQPTSNHAREDPESRLLHLRVEGTNREIVYGVDAPDRRVRLVALLSLPFVEERHA